MSKFYTSVERRQDFILFRGYENGVSVKEKIPFKPTLYVPNASGEYKALDGRPLAPINFGSISEAQDFTKQYKDVGNYEIHGNQNWVAQYITHAFPEDVEFDPSLVNVAFVDIETMSDEGFPKPEEARQAITAITVKYSKESNFYVYALGEWSKENSIDEVKEIPVKYIRCDTEAELLHRFYDEWERQSPEIITGWNSRFFDTVYIMNRTANVLGSEHVGRISPWFKQVRNPYSAREIKMGGKVVHAFEILGLQQLDYLELFKKFAYSYGMQESYKLDHIANVVLGEKKVDYSEYGSLHELYVNNHQLYLDYNIKDVELIVRMEEKMNLISLCMAIAYKAHANYSDAFGVVGTWDSFIYNDLMRRNVICPPKKNNHKDGAIEGAFVKVPQGGMHNWIVSFDLTSLYPSLMMQYNMSPETIVPDNQLDANIDSILEEKVVNQKPQYALSGTGQYFSREQRGFVPTIIEKLMKERKETKKQMLASEQRIDDIKQELKKRGVV